MYEPPAPYATTSTLFNFEASTFVLETLPSAAMLYASCEGIFPANISAACAAAVVAAAALDSPRTSFNSTTGFSAILSPNTAVNPLISTSSTAFIPFAKPNTASISSIVIPASANALLTAFVRPASEPVSVPNLTFE